MSKDISVDKIIVPKYESIILDYQRALQCVDDVILKNYVSKLSELDVVPLDQEVLKNNIKENVLFFKVNEIVYEKNEFISYKFASVFNSLANTKSAVFIIIDSNGTKTDFYMGIRSFDEQKTTSSIKKILENAMFGNFPGIKTTNYKVEDMEKIIKNIKVSSISSVSCVANSREEKQNKNEEFVQGLEKLVLSMSGKKYTGIIIANITEQNQIRALRREYENIYTQLSPFSENQINYGQNSTSGKNESIAEGTNESISRNVSKSDTEGTASTTGTSVSQENPAARIIKGVGGAGTLVAGVLGPLTGGASLALSIGLQAFSQAANSIASAVSKTTSNSSSSSKNRSHTYSESSGTTTGTSRTYTSGTNITEGLSKAITLTTHNKSIENILVRIDKQLKRMDEFESLGMYECAAYFLSEEQYISEMAASTYKALMGGENTGVEVIAINSWGNYEKNKTLSIEKYIKNFMHPIFKYKAPFGNIEVTAGSMISANELSIHIGLPRKSVSGFPVIEHADFAKEVVKYEENLNNQGVSLGNIYNMGRSYPNNIFLDKNSLTMHTFVTGSTGSGKSNTVYELIRQCNSLGAKFMVIEPAKGEYKHVFGNREDVKVLGTNPQYSDILRINPFKFPKGIHILEHIDRLIEIFNVCWPMYAAMPAVLKEALLKSYEDCGWDFSKSKNLIEEDLFPTFLDLQESLVEIISSSAYSEEVKSNYMGSLVTRVKSLTNGLNGQIFMTNEIDNKILFDENVIIDLSRIGSLETKSLIMGLLIMKLNEHRMSNTSEMNVPFKHLTVLEEAHNILKRTSTEQNPESPSVSGKSVEMLSNAIAEMRTYGEAFIIVDQSPTAIDISAIKNTNTKIIMRLPDETDRRLVGKSAGLKDEQLDEIAKLPKGVAVVYQNDWVEPVLCKIHKYKGEESQYKYEAIKEINNSTNRLKANFLKLLLKTKVNNPIDINIDQIEKDLRIAEISSKNKIKIKNIINEYKDKEKLSLWDEDNIESLSKEIYDFLNGSVWLKSITDRYTDYNILTDKLVLKIKEISDKNISSDYLMAISECLMRQDKKNIEWRNYHKNKGSY